MPTKKSNSKATSATRYKSLLAGQWSGDLMLGALFAEMFGTFVLAAAVLLTSGSIIIAALTVVIMVMALSRLSGGHLNPGVTIALLATRQISVLRAGGYIVAQLLGAMLALLVVTQFVSTGQPDPNLGQPMKVFEAQALVGDWRPFFAELLGAIVFGFGLAASILNKKEGIDAGYTIGGSLLLGLLLASQASAAILNPAVALGLSAYKVGVSGAADGGWVTVWVYALAPILGLTIGAWLYKLMKWDVTGKQA